MMNLRQCLVTGFAFAILVASVGEPSLANLSVSVRLSNQDLGVSLVELAATSEVEDYMRVKLVYNSISNFSHVFGYAWGSDLDTNLVTLPDGRLWYTAYGNGFTRVFSQVSSSDSANMLNQIEDGSIQEGAIGSRDELEAYSKDLSEWYVMDLYESMRYAGYLVPGETPAGVVFSDYENGPARVVSFPEGYQLIILGNSAQDPLEADFDNGGRLVRAWVHNDPQHFVAYRWGAIAIKGNNLGERDRVLEMNDYRGNIFNFTYNHNNGRVIRIATNRFGAVEYGYDESDNLAWQRGASGLYRFSYDNYHNLTRIYLPKGNPMIFSYASIAGYLKSLQCSDGTIYEITKLSEKNGLATSVRVETRRKNGTTTSQTMTSSELGVYTYCS